jgi:hypothetical protein
MAERNSHGEYGAGRPSTSRKVVNSVLVNEIILKNGLNTFRDPLHSKIMQKWKWMVVNARAMILSSFPNGTDA